MKLEKNSMKIRWRKNLTLSNLQKKKQKRGGGKRKFQKITEKTNDCLDSRKTKMIVEFNDHESSSIKSFSVKKEIRLKQQVNL